MRHLAAVTDVKCDEVPAQIAGRRRSQCMKTQKKLLAIEQIESRIFEVRAQRVMLDSDLAELYGVETRRLNEQVKRNLDRFPADFMFSLSNQELALLMSQNATSSESHGGRRKTPRVFTEHGAVMLANVLSSPEAIKMSVHVVRAFIRTRKLIDRHTELAAELNSLKQHLQAKFGAYDQKFHAVFEAINRLISPPAEKKRRRIGFRND